MRIALIRVPSHDVRFDSVKGPPILLYAVQRHLTDSFVAATYLRSTRHLWY
jgi:hypothetical protein